MKSSTNVTVKRVRVAIAALKKQELLHIVASVALIIHHAKRMRRIILYSEVTFWLYILSHNLRNGTFFGKMPLHKICVSIFFTTYV